MLLDQGPGIHLYGMHQLINCNCLQGSTIIVAPLFAREADFVHSLVALVPILLKPTCAAQLAEEIILGSPF
jgi:hypothetical protein